MDFSRLVDGLIEPFSPSTVRRRMAERLALQEIRQYDAASKGRRNSGWHRPSSSAARETKLGLVALRDSGSELVRNNKYAASALRQMTAHAIGDGITARAVHEDETVAQIAQDHWDRTAEKKLDGRHDHYGQQKQIFRTVGERGEALALWGPDSEGPDGMCRIVEGDYLDHTVNRDATETAAAIVQGVQFDADGFRQAYWLTNGHPGDGRGFSRRSKPYAAANVDHIFEELRPGQPRGLSWFAPVAMTLRDIADYEDALLMKRKVEACLALVLTPPENGTPTTPFDEPPGVSGGNGQGNAEPATKQPDKMRPGMVFRARPGETATSVNPSSSGDGMDFVRQQLMGVSANLAPYHLVTGDPSQANYSSLRALTLGFWANLDDWQWNMMVPLFCQPAFERAMRRLALQTGDRRFLKVKPSFSMPVRRFVDPIKDAAGVSAELRLGLEFLPAPARRAGPELEGPPGRNGRIQRRGGPVEPGPRRRPAPRHPVGRASGRRRLPGIGLTPCLGRLDPERKTDARHPDAP